MMHIYTHAYGCGHFFSNHLAGWFHPCFARSGFGGGSAMLVILLIIGVIAAIACLHDNKPEKHETNIYNSDGRNRRRFFRLEEEEERREW